ncbi:hypothetical protein [Hyphomicrobium sp. CS1GBMeth3]|uniref:hypothetical protein n=1 Tax=Hyphomicrobium sp. CS1GBMeth3 TaxID=1892845 RepID=UPI00092FE375|nr:hypothetical protein [Hyphomicrobium sp. CS1GBMeth3]
MHLFGLTMGRRAVRARMALAAVALVTAASPAVNAAPQQVGPFESLEGWWGGNGRLRFVDGKTEDVKCRATYFVEGEGHQLRQNIRCASASGKIEVKSTVRHADGKLSGEWTEEMYNVTGVLAGDVTERGYRVSVEGTQGSMLSANMEIIVRDKRQMVEIQFFSETLIGLTLLLNKG